MALIFTLMCGWHAHAQPPQTDAAPSIAANKRTAAKLEKIVIPLVDFHETTLPEAIEYCRKQGILLDKSERKPTSRGVKIVIDPRTLARDEKPASFRLSMKDAPLGVVLSYISNLTNARIRVSNGAVIIVPSDAEDPVITRKWVVGAKRLAQARLKPGDHADEFTPRSDPHSARDLKEGLPSLVVSRDGKRLIARGTEVQLDLIDAILKASF